MEKLIAGAMRQVRQAHGDILPGSVARRVAAQLWAETSGRAHQDDARWVRHVRGTLGTTQEELAQRLGTVQVTVARWESGKTRPAPYYRRALEHLARVGNPASDPDRPSFAGRAGAS